MKKVLVVAALLFLTQAPAGAQSSGWQFTPLQGPYPPSAVCSGTNIYQVYWDTAAAPWQQYVCTLSGWVQIGVGTGDGANIWTSGTQIYINSQYGPGGFDYIFGGGIPKAETSGGVKGWGAFANIVMNGQGMPTCTTCEYNYIEGFGGGQALTTGYANDGIGDSFASSVTTGAGNSGVGDATCQGVTTGNDNVCVGASALSQETTGSDNVAIGQAALGGQATASGVVGVGVNALSNNNADFNDALGYQALAANTSGVENNAFGADTLVSVTTAGNDTAMGNGALMNTTAGQLSAFGAEAGDADTTGNLNVFVGYAAGVTGPTTGAQDELIGGMAETGAAVNLAAQIGYGTNNYSDTFQFNGRQEFDDGGNFNANLVVQSVGTPIASAPAIAPTSFITHVTGNAVITTIVPPTVTVNGSGFTGCLVLVPDGHWSTGASGNIALATDATVGRALTECYDGEKWYPSY